MAMFYLAKNEFGVLVAIFKFVELCKYLKSSSISWEGFVLQWDQQSMDGTYLCAAGDSQAQRERDREMES